MRSLFRRVTLVLILSAVLVPGLAQAEPRISAAERIAAVKERATAELAREVAGFLGRARQEPGVRFERRWAV